MSKQPDQQRLDDIVAAAQKGRQQRERGYRAQALKLLPWICGRCRREFTRDNVQELTVHHRDHDHDNNPADGSNWELLCLYCHDNEHQRALEGGGGERAAGSAGDQRHATHNPFAGLDDLLKR